MPPKYWSKFKLKWLQDPDFKDWLKPDPMSEHYALCSIFDAEIHSKSMRVGAVRKHHKGEKHQDLLPSALDKSKSTIAVCLVDRNIDALDQFQMSTIISCQKRWYQMYAPPFPSFYDICLVLVLVYILVLVYDICLYLQFIIDQFCFQSKYMFKFNHIIFFCLEIF